MKRTDLSLISGIVLDAVNAALKDHGYEAVIQGGKFGTNTFEPKLIIKLGGIDLDKMKFEGTAPLFGLKPADYGTQLDFRGVSYTLVGLNLRRPTYPVEARTVDGRRFKLPASAIEHLKAKP